MKTLKEYTAPLGTVYSASPAAVSVASKTYTIIASLSLPAGTYVIAGYMQWAISSSAGTVLFLRVPGYKDVVERSTMSGGGGNSLSQVAVLESAQTVNLHGYHGYSAAVKTQDVNLRAIRIK